MLNFIKKINDGIMAGLLIAVGGCVFLNAESKVVGAVFFSVALLCICMRGYSLFTGKVCYIPANHSKEAFSVLLLGLLGNTIATILIGWAVRYAIPSIGAAAETVCASKLTQDFFQTLIRGFLCGTMVYLSVAIYREKNTPIAILFCIPTFILSGFEHSIADIFYFAASGMVSLKAFGFLWTVILGNILGGIFLPVLEDLGKKKAEAK